MGAGDGITITSVVERRALQRATRLALSVSATRARAWRKILVVSGVLAGLIVVVAATSGSSWLLAFLVFPTLLVAASGDGAVTRTLCRQMWRAARSTPEFEIHADPDGIGSVQGGLTVGLAWAVITDVAETPDETVFVSDSGRRLSFVVVGARSLTPDQRATIHRWARQAPGERRWFTFGARHAATSASPG